MNISVVILTYNEEINLKRCIESIDWCDDVLVVDSYSEDRTVDLARSLGARILVREFDNFANQRNFAHEHGALKYDWVLHLDADEVATDAFNKELESLAPPQDIYAFRVPSKTILAGKWLRRAGMYPSYQVRLGRLDKLRFKQVGHGQREDLDPRRVGTFNEPYLHYNFSKGMKDWFAKHIRYARDEATEIVTRKNDPSVNGDSSGGRHKLKLLANKVPPILRPMLRFIYVYFWRRGFLDGRAGLLYALMMSIYEGMIAVLLIERKINSGDRSS